MSDIILSLGARRSIRDIAGFDELLARTQQRLTTSKRVNNVIDNAEKFFSARDFQGLALNYEGYIENTAKGIDLIQIGADALDAVERLATQIKSLTSSAKATPPNRVALFGSIHELYKQIDLLVKDATYETRNLLDNTNLLIYRVGNLTSSEYKIQAQNLLGMDITKGGLISVAVLSLVDSAADVQAGLNAITGLPAATSFANTSYEAQHFDMLINTFDRSITRSRSFSEAFGTAVSVLQIRQRFNKSYRTVSQTAAERLVAADLNEEGANLVTLQTRRELGIEALAAEGRNVRAILNLLR